MGKGLEVIVNSSNMGGDVSSVNKDCKLLLLPANMETKEKKKKKKDASSKEKRKRTNVSKKRGYSSTPPNSEDTEKHQTAPPHDTSIPPSPPQGSGGQGQRSKGRQEEQELKDVTMMSSSGSEKEKRTAICPGGAPAPSSEGVSLELSAQATESLRWEGVLEEPLAEERRLAVYRANRRQRYLLHRQEVIAAGAQATILRAEMEWKH
ncbi:protein LIAT1-like [Coregonus clupeaformis]|uniref:Protein LIAT1 n=1 Tax=Coregonus suidteri TaxID=861788 RepID=A0AAN8LQ57_9TELE|nr:protein LIAT1-like [Coregonus clupeaformis]XP_045080527.1 protein LIAT1-like [Coregonus clupeaformis]